MLFQRYLISLSQETVVKIHANASTVKTQKISLETKKMIKMIRKCCWISLKIQTKKLKKDHAIVKNPFVSRNIVSATTTIKYVRNHVNAKTVRTTDKTRT